MYETVVQLREFCIAIRAHTQTHWIYCHRKLLAAYRFLWPRICAGCPRISWTPFVL